MLSSQPFLSRNRFFARPAVLAGFSCVLLAGLPAVGLAPNTPLTPQLPQAQAQIQPQAQPQIQAQSQTDTGTITVVQAEKDGTVLQVQKDVAPGGQAVVRGQKWGAGSTITVKLNVENNAQLTRTQGIINHPGNGQPDHTIWAQFNADSDGNFEEKITLPSNLQAGQALRVNAASGLIAGQEQHSLTSPWLVVGGVEYVPPKKEIIACTNTTPKPEIKAAKLAVDGKVKIAGTGFCNTESGGARVAFKFNAGQVTRTDGKYANATIWHVEQADPKNGTLDLELDLPTPANSKNILQEGEHTIQVLSGSLQENDPVFTTRLPFVVGEYRPSVPPEPVHYEEHIPKGSEHDLSITENKNSLRVSVKGGKKGDWVFASTYIADGSPRLPWGNYWARLDEKGELTLPLDTVNGKPVRVPEGALKLVIQSGNQDNKNAVLGWNWWEPKNPTVSAPRPGNSGTSGTAGTGNNGTADPGTAGTAGASGTAGAAGGATGGTGAAGQAAAPNSKTKQIDEFTAAVGTLDGELKKLLTQVENSKLVTKPAESDAGYAETAHYDDGALATDAAYADENYRVVQASTVDNVSAGIAQAPAAGQASAANSGGAQNSAGTNFAVDASAIQQPDNPASNWPAKPEHEVNQPVDKREDLDESNSGGLAAVFDGDLVYIQLPTKQPGDWVFLHIYIDDKTKTTPVGWAQVDEFGEIAFDTSGLPDGSYTLAISDDSGLLGWVDLDLGNQLAENSMGRTAASPRLATASASAMSAADWGLIAAGLLISVVAAAAVGIVARKKR
ncbi:hypothetical protein [Corynebacterium propinquum]|uniref:hypothetical protein n=1 Tax=Corynebacterium propinquum TaxID=43769 RepID=UPI0006691E87|nr:hypothetical protein [Corynebacterium propinquum]